MEKHTGHARGIRVRRRESPEPTWVKDWRVDSLTPGVERICRFDLTARDANVGQQPVVEGGEEAHGAQ